MSNYVSTDHLSKSNTAFVSQLSSVSIPNSMLEALVDPKWSAAMDEELNALKKKKWQLANCWFANWQEVDKMQVDIYSKVYDI